MSFLGCTDTYITTQCGLLPLPLVPIIPSSFDFNSPRSITYYQGSAKYADWKKDSDLEKDSAGAGMSCKCSPKKLHKLLKLCDIRARTL